MSVRKAKKSPEGSTIYYVRSESDPAKEYIVVEISREGILNRFCQCPDFFCRRLPTIGTATFEMCKHGMAVADAIEKGEVQ